MRRRSLNKAVRFEVLKRDHNRCTYCGVGAADAVLQCDHVVPVCLGGTDDMENLRTACRDCNLGKGARRLDDRSRILRQLELIPKGEQAARPDPAIHRVFYIQGILRNRFRDPGLRCVGALRDRLRRGITLDALEDAAKKSRDWPGFDRLARE